MVMAVRNFAQLLALAIALGIWSTAGIIVWLPLLIGATVIDVFLSVLLIFSDRSYNMPLVAKMSEAWPNGFMRILRSTKPSEQKTPKRNPADAENIVKGSIYLVLSVSAASLFYWVVWIIFF